MKIITIISIFILGLIVFGYQAWADSQFNGVYTGDSDQNPNIALTVNIVGQDVSGETHLKQAAGGVEFSYAYTGTVTDTTIEKTSPQGEISGTVKGKAQTESIKEDEPDYLTSGTGTISGTIENNIIKIVLDLNISLGEKNTQRQLTATLTKQGEIAETEADEEEIKEPQKPEDVVNQPDSGARFSGMTGQVEWRADDDPDGWKLCKMGDKLPVYAHIRTQEDSSAILSFSDMSTFVLKADSEVVIDTPPEKESKIKLVAGNIWVNVKKMIQDGSMEIEMNQAVAGIKGTTFTLSDDGKSSTLQVIEGKVLFTSKFNGEKADVVGGSMVSASSAGLGSVETFDTAKVTADWDSVSKSTQEANVSSDKDADGVTSNKLLFLYGLIGVLVIFAGIIIIRKIKR